MAVGHDWLEERGPWLSLLGAIDDATGKVPHALFREQEDAQGYFLCVPGRFYGIFCVEAFSNMGNNSDSISCLIPFYQKV